MKRISVIIAAALLVFSACSESQSGKGYSIVDDTIVFDTPERAEGQESVLGLRTDPLETVRVGFIGLGMRGPDAWKKGGMLIRACLPFHQTVHSAGPKTRYLP